MDNTDSNVKAPKSRVSLKLKVSLAVLVAVTALAAFKVSIISLGSDRVGHTAIIWKDEGTDSLRLFDSDRAACKRKGEAEFFCEGRLAIVIQDRNLRLIGLPYSSTYSDMVGGN